MERHILIALDDSGSMGNERFPAGRPGNDPYRLSRFATRALLALLPDDAFATVITMGNNGLDTARGARPAPIPPLDRLKNTGERGNRDALEALLLAPIDISARGALTQHDLPETPCQRVLDGIEQELNRAYRSGAVQTAFLLSDGRCTDRMRIDAFLNALKAEKAAREFEREGRSGPRPFQFYFVCMGSEGCSPELGALAARTGGASFRAASAAHLPEPAELIDIFGQVIGRSQGVCPIVYSDPDERARLQRFPGSSGTQLLAVPGTDESVKLAPPRGVPIVSAREAEHHWGGRTFRFAAGLIPPLRTAIPLPLESSGSARLLAIPRYDAIRLSMRLLEGSCDGVQLEYRADAPAFKPSSALPAGSTVCVELALLGRDDQPIAREGMGRAISAAIALKRPGSEQREAISVLAERETRFERFLYEIPNLAPGTISLEGWVELSPDCLDRTVARPTGGEATRIRAPRRSHEVSRVEFAIDTAGDDENLYTISPGGTSVVYGALRFSGNFEPGAAISIQRRDSRPDREHPHRCVELYYGDQRVPFMDEPPIEISATVGSGNSLTLRAAAYCGFREDKSVREIPISFRLVKSGVEALAIVRYQLINEIELARELAITLKAAGPHLDVPWGPISGSGEATQRFTARIDRANASAALPDGLELGFVPPEIALSPRGDKAELLEEIEFTVQPGSGGPPLFIRSRALRCCEAEAIRIPIVLRPIDNDGGAGEPMSSILIVNAERDRFWSCYGPRILLATYTLIALFILWLIRNFFIKIRLLPGESGPSIHRLIARSTGNNMEYICEYDWIRYDDLKSNFGGKLLRRMRIAARNPFSILLQGTMGHETIYYDVNSTNFISPRNPKHAPHLATHKAFRRAIGTTVKRAEPAQYDAHKSEGKLSNNMPHNEVELNPVTKISSGFYLRSTSSRSVNAYAVKLGIFYPFLDEKNSSRRLAIALDKERSRKRGSAESDGPSFEAEHGCIQLSAEHQIILRDFAKIRKNDFVGVRVSR